MTTLAYEALRLRLQADITSSMSAAMPAASVTYQVNFLDENVVIDEEKEKERCAQELDDLNKQIDQTKLAITKTTKTSNRAIINQLLMRLAELQMRRSTALTGTLHEMDTEPITDRPPPTVAPART